MHQLHADETVIGEQIAFAPPFICYVVGYSAHSPLGLFSGRLHPVLRLLLTSTSYFYNN